MISLRLTLGDVAAIAPLLILLLGSLAILLLESFYEKGARKYSAWFTATVMAIAFVAAYLAPTSTNELLTPWIRFDFMARFFTLLFLAIGFTTTLLAIPFFQRFESSRGEFHFLLIAAVMGLILVGDSADFLTLFIGLETLSLALYVLCGYMKKWSISQEASIKYFLTGALAAAFLLYGIALVYGAVGTTGFAALLPAYKGLDLVETRILFLTGISLVSIGLAFKAAVVPFHVWAPDVYEGATTPVTAFMAVGTKAGAFAAFAVIFIGALAGFNAQWNQWVSFASMVTLVYANFVALKQTQLRRFFAYSGISHAGFLLIPLVAGGEEAFDALAFYLIVYVAATLVAFAVLAFLDETQEGVMLKDLKGLFYRSPFLAGAFSFALLTLAGIPPTAGFLAKFFVLSLAFEAGYYALVIVALLMTIVAAFYYLRIVAVMFSELPEEATPLKRAAPALVIACCSLLVLVVISLYPDQLLDLLGP